MNLTKIDRILARKFMYLSHVEGNTYYDMLKMENVEFNPTVNTHDAFRLIYRLQRDWAWSIQMTNEECEVEVQFGTGYYSDKFVAKAICLAILKHFKYDLKQFESE